MERRICVVLFASALFFVVMSTELTSTKLRRDAGVWVCRLRRTAVWVATSPVNVST
jgi:hypothetical protein